MESTMATTIERRRLSEIVAERIRKHIVDNNLRPGDRLPTEHELAHRFGVSRVAVREATRALGFLGLVEASPRRGLTIGALNLQRVTPFLQLDPRLQEASSAELIETRTVVETGGLPLVMDRMRRDPSIYDRLSTAVDAFHQADDLARWIELDIAFHRQLLEASGLSPLVAFNGMLEVFFHRFRESVERAEWQEGIRSHRRIINALRDGKLSTAIKTLRRHIESHRTRTRSKS
jgi:DNA-binding FadR family transcriptional regulator